MATPTANSQARVQVNATAKRRQQYLLIALCLFAVIVAFVLTWIARPQMQVLTQIGDEPRLAVPATQTPAGELWRTGASREIEQLQQDWEQLQTSIHELQGRLGNVEQDVSARNALQAEQAFEQELLELLAAEPRDDSTLQNDVTYSVVPPVPQPSIKLVRVEPQLPQLDITELAPTIPTQLEPPPPPPATATIDVVLPKTKNYLPSGSFMPAVILGGLDAPTGAISRDNPYPVLLHISSHARLPNQAQLDLKECFVLAAGYGDIGSERALLRTEKLSCQRRDGSFIDTQLRGFVVGEDGRAGVRGRLVTKQGQILQRSLLAGIGAGMSEIFRTRQANHLEAAKINQADNAATSIPGLSVENYALAGLSSGLQSSLDRLANYYITMAERVHPIIEVGAGRKVDIVVQEGLELGR